MATIIRDFAYDASDERFKGIYPSLTEESKSVKDKPQAIPQSILSLDDDEDDDEGDIDYSAWEWSWTYNNTKKKKSALGIYYLRP